MNPTMNVHKIVMVTGDDRVAELIEGIKKIGCVDCQGKHYPPFDVVVTPLATGSKEYIEWVVLQTQKRDAATAFFNIQPTSSLPDSVALQMLEDIEEI